MGRRVVVWCSQGAKLHEKSFTEAHSRLPVGLSDHLDVTWAYGGVNNVTGFFTAESLAAYLCPGRSKHVTGFQTVVRESIVRMRNVSREAAKNKVRNGG
jgi:hypothetical protein